MSDYGRRRHSIFGDYILADKKHSSADVPDDVLAKIRDYNALWSRYAKDVVGKWGLASVPTEKGFAEWLNKKIEEAK